MGFTLKTSLFHVCSSHDMLMPLSRLLALLKAIYLIDKGFGLLFATTLCTPMLNKVSNDATTVRNFFPGNIFFTYFKQI